MSIEIHLPKFHIGQQRIYNASTRFDSWCCGRRFGKTVGLESIACGEAATGNYVGWFTPKYKVQAEAYAEMSEILHPIIKSSSKMDGLIRTITGGRIDFWTLEDDRAGRSRKYHLVVIDEAAFTKPNMMEIWERSIAPTLLDYGGRAIVASTPNGINEDNFFYRICHDPKYGFTTHHAPSSANPFMPTGDLERLAREADPLVFQQEYLAKFVDWRGAAFFSIDKMLVEGQPVEPWTKSDMVYAVIDTAVKAGKEHDGTAVVYYMYDKYRQDYNLIVLDWDILQIEGSLLEAWLPNVQRRLEELGQGCRYSDKYIYIEDKASGSILIQQAHRRNMNVLAIEGKLTSAGKDERGISISGYVYQGKVKISKYAYDKTLLYKEITRNHFLSQVSGFKIGVDNGADDLYDAFTYGVSIGLGNVEGY